MFSLHLCSISFLLRAYAVQYSCQYIRANEHEEKKFHSLNGVRQGDNGDELGDMVVCVTAR
jgi:hypothetical protein